MPHNKIRANVAVADQAIAPFFVRRVEQFIEQHAGDDIALADLTDMQISPIQVRPHNYCGSSPPWLHPPRCAEQCSGFYQHGGALERT